MAQDGVTMSGDLSISLNALEQEFPKYAKAALYAGAAALKEDVKSNLTTRLPAATQHNPKYNDTLVDAVRNSKTPGDVITVHILGGNKPGSGAYRTRFFENGTQERFQKSRNGVKLKKKKSLGRLKDLHFFSDGITSGEAKAIQQMQTIMDRFFEKYGK